MKKRIITVGLLILVLLFSSCNKIEHSKNDNPVLEENVVEISLSDEEIKTDGEAVSRDVAEDIYIGNDIVYYEVGKDFTYGEGTEKDTHTEEEAAEHRVLHITKAGTYRLSGKLSKGQIAVDLGNDAKTDPKAVVTLILNGVDITCDVAPAVIFYNVYECGTVDTDTATKDVDTSSAGANVIISDDTQNKVQGSYVARIYNPDSVILNEDKTEVEDAKKLHKYDGAFYSRMSMNIDGEEKGTGTLDIYAENEGMDSELHLTVNGGNINIYSGNDGINTNEDGVSVTTVNGGVLNIQVTGETGEGDGIDSNGWLVINGGSVTASACSNSADAGIDSDMGIHLNGGYVIASGHMLDRIEDGGQTYAVFNFAQKQDGEESVTLRKKEDQILMHHIPKNDYSVLVFSSPDLIEYTYSLWVNDEQMEGQSGGMGSGFGMPGGMRPDGEMPGGMQPGEMPERFPGGMPDGEMPEEFPGGMPDGEMPEGFPGGEFPQNRPEMQKGENRPFDSKGPVAEERLTEFKITDGANIFSNIS